MTEPKVSLVTPVFNGISDTVEYLSSLSQISYRNYEVVIVDDGSTDGSSRIIAEKFPDVHLLRGNGNLWWAGATNLGVTDALNRGADFVLTINNDNEVSADFLSALVDTAIENEDCIVKSVGFDYEDRELLRFFGGEISWWRGQINQIMAQVDRSRRTVEVPFGNGNSTLIPVKVFQQIGLYDEGNCPQYHADSEFLLRAKKSGFRILVDNQSIIYNKVDKSVGKAAVEKMNFVTLLKNRRSPYYLKANYKIYRDYCPYRFFLFFLLIRYIHLLKDHLKRRSEGS